MEANSIIRHAEINIEKLCEYHKIRYEVIGKNEYLIFIPNKEPIYLLDNSVREVSMKLERYLG